MILLEPDKNSFHCACLRNGRIEWHVFSDIFLNENRPLAEKIFTLVFGSDFYTKIGFRWEVLVEAI